MQGKTLLLQVAVFRSDDGHLASATLLPPDMEEMLSPEVQVGQNADNNIANGGNRPKRYYYRQ
jgi:hypothetical protein